MNLLLYNKLDMEKNKLIDIIFFDTGDSFNSGIELWSLDFFLVIISSFILMALGGLFIWMYYRQKNDFSLKEKYKQKSIGSFKGFWARYRGAIYSFLSAIFILFGILFFLWAFGIIGNPAYNPM